MLAYRLLMLMALLLIAPTATRAVEAWMPEAPHFHGLVWDLAPAPLGDCERVTLSDQSLLARLAKMAGIRMPLLYLCAGPAAAAWTLPPRALAVTGELAGLPYCQKAFVLGHELAHLAMHHAEETALALRDLARLPTASAADAFAAADFDMALLLQLSPLLRAQESEADRLGVMLAAGLGCRLDQSGLAYLKQLPAKNSQAVVATHAATSQRVRELQPFSASANTIVEQRRQRQAVSRQVVSRGGF